MGEGLLRIFRLDLWGPRQSARFWVLVVSTQKRQFDPFFRLLVAGRWPLVCIAADLVWGFLGQLFWVYVLVSLSCITAVCQAFIMVSSWWRDECVGGWGKAASLSYFVNIPCICMMIGLYLFMTSGGTRRCPGWEIAKEDIWKHMEGQRLETLGVIYIIAIP